MVDYKSLYQAHIEKFQMKGGVQATGLCIDHDDTKPSLSINIEDGVCYCHACGFRANAYQVAVAVGHPNPREYIVDNGVGVGSVAIQSPEPSSSVVSPTKKANRQDDSPKDKNIEKLMEQYKQNLKNNEKQFPLSYIRLIAKGTQDLIDVVDIGLDERGNLAFGLRNQKGELIGIKIHKKHTIGNGKSKLYLKHLLGRYDHDKVLYICEGEKDTITLFSYGYQAVSGTCGAISIPKDENGDYEVDFIQYFNNDIVFVYDNDDAGYKGADKWANQLVNKYKSHNIKIAQWDESLPKSFDVFDAFDKDQEDVGADFFDAVANAVLVKPYVPDTLGRFNVIGGMDADQMKYKKTFQLIDTILPEFKNILIGGTKGCNKSTFGMQLIGSLVNDRPEFLDFKINKKGVSGLIVDTEIGKDLALERREMLQKNFPEWNDDTNRRFNMISLDASSDDESDIFQSIEEAIILFNPDVVLIDCLYNIAGGEDISKNHNIDKITSVVTRLKIKYNITIILIAHATKGNYEQGLVSDRIAGGSHLQNWAEHIMVLTESGIEDNLRLMRIDKSRCIPFPKDYFGLELDEATFYLSNAGVIVNPKAHMISPDKRHKWAMALENMQDEFTTIDFRNQVECIMKKSDRTARNWLTDMKRTHVIEDVGYGKWKKKLKLISEEDE